VAVAPLVVEVVDTVDSPSPPDPQPEMERNTTLKVIEQARPMIDF
jgi:hypothetical protein